MPRFRTSLPLEDELEKIRRLAAAAPAAGSAAANENDTESRWVTDPKRSTWSWARDDVKPSTEAKTTTENEPVKIPVEPYTAPTNEELGIHTLGQGQPGDKSFNARIEAYDQQTTDMGIPQIPDLSRGDWGLPYRDSEFMSNRLDKAFGQGDLLESAGLKVDGNKLSDMTIKSAGDSASAGISGAAAMAGIGKMLQNLGEKQTTELPSPPTQQGGSDKAQQTIALVQPGKELEKFMNLWGS